MNRQEIIWLRHPAETSRFILCAIALIVTVSLMILGYYERSDQDVPTTIGSVIGALIGIYFLFWFTTNFFTSLYMNNSVKVTASSFPDIWGHIEAAKTCFQFPGQVDAYIVESGRYHSKTRLLLRKRAIIIHSELVVDPNARGEVKFIIGRFVGSHAARKGRFDWVEFLLTYVEGMRIFNLFLRPYERVLQYSADQMGLYFVEGDLESALRALVKYMVGRRAAHQVNFKAILQQEVETRGQFFNLLTRLASPYPHPTSRMANLIRFGHEYFPDETMKCLRNMPELNHTSLTYDKIINSGSKHIIDSDSRHNSKKIDGRSIPSPQHQAFTMKSIDQPVQSYKGFANTVTVGRHQENEIVLNNTSVSRRHACIKQTNDGRFWLDDRQSKNGTFVNGRRVDKASLETGDIVGFGDLDFHFSID